MGRQVEFRASAGPGGGNEDELLKVEEDIVVWEEVVLDMFVPAAATTPPIKVVPVDVDVYVLLDVVVSIEN